MHRILPVTDNPSMTRLARRTLPSISQGRDALRAAGVALLAFAIGELLRAASPGIALWPLGPALLGWFAGSADRAAEDAPLPGLRAPLASVGTWSGAVAGAAAVAFLCALRDGAAAAAASVAAGFVLPAAAAVALAAAERVGPPRAVGSRQLRLLCAALACVPVSAALRSDLLPGGLPGGLAGARFMTLLFGDMLAAAAFAPMAAALAGAGPFAALRASPALLQASIAIPLCAAAVAGLLATGHAEVARIAVILHLLTGLRIALSVHGTAGAVLLALNGGAMAQLQAGWLDPLVPHGGDDLRATATLLMLTAVLALQSVLHGAGNDSRDAARTLIRQALSSDLSGLPNQRALGRIVDAALARPARTTFWMVGVVLPDIARWSDLTDSVAAAGIERAVGDRLRSAFEPMGARVAHPASGRFVVMLGDRVDGIAIRQGLRRSLGGQRFDVSEQSIHLRYHAGMVEVPAHAEVGADSVLAALSMALQRAAADPTGIHRVTVSAELLDGYRTELRTVELVSRAINEGRVRLFAERIESAAPAATPVEGLHFEVLVRVIDDEDKLLEPKRFLPAVWHAGLSSKLDRLVLIRTVAHLAAHPNLHAATRLCSINVAGPTLCDPEFPDFVKRALSTHRVDPQRLAIEITESSAIPDLELARAHVQRLADMGLSIALDDFGTGLATFDYLKRLHADILKIDGSFIRQIVDHPLDREIVSAIVRIARASGARTVAEWIETPEQRDIVRALGVDYLQGRLIAHPVPIERLALPEAALPKVADLSLVPFEHEHGRRRSRGRATRGAVASRGR